MLKNFTNLLLAPFFMAAFAILSGCASIDTSGASIDDIRGVNDTAEAKWPIVYSPDYNISFAGLEKLHPFDTHKYGRVFKSLKAQNILSKDTVYEPPRPAVAVLSRHHSEVYLQNLERSETIAKFTEISAVEWLPNRAAYNAIMEPAKRASSGSILAGELSLDYGWAINLGGGYHHASKNYAGGFCAIADIALSIHHLRDNNSQIEKVMIVDLDAHQGNGHARDFARDENTFILDMYNEDIYPRDEPAKAGIDLAVPLSSFTTDEVYLSKLETSLEQAYAEFAPDVIYYVAGTDLLAGDKLGKLSISANGIIKRDHLVFAYATKNNVPIVMLLAGGYQKNNAEIIAASISNLIESFDLKPERFETPPH